MPMDSDRLNTLLDKYWNCETSLEEEAALREYFRDGTFPEHLKDTASLFHYFDARKTTTISDVSFDRGVMDKLHGRKKNRVRRLVYNSMRMAAGLVVLVVAAWLVRNEIRSDNRLEPTDTYTDPKIAFDETKKALMMISRSFGTAEEQARKINLFNEAQEEVRQDENEETENNL